MASEFYYVDFDDYSALFSKHSAYIVKLMSILNYQLLEHGLNPIEDSSKLFRRVYDLLYHTDLTYRAEKNIPDKYDLVTFSTKTNDEMLDSMRSLLKEELDRYLGYSDATNQ
jgi:hypothetical protein